MWKDKNGDWMFPAPIAPEIPIPIPIAGIWRDPADDLPLGQNLEISKELDRFVAESLVTIFVKEQRVAMGSSSTPSTEKVGVSSQSQCRVSSLMFKINEQLERLNARERELERLKNKIISQSKQPSLLRELIEKVEHEQNEYFRQRLGSVEF